MDKQGWLEPSQLETARQLGAMLTFETSRIFSTKNAATNI